MTMEMEFDPFMFGSNEHRTSSLQRDPFKSQSCTLHECLRQVASSRWLNVHEIIDILNNYSVYGLSLAQNHNDAQPGHGTIFVCHTDHLNGLKQDGIDWIKRLNSNKVREDHLNLKLNRVVVIRAYHTHAVEPVSLHRRRYHLSDSSSKLSLIHYLDVKIAENLRKDSSYSKYISHSLTHLSYEDRRKMGNSPIRFSQNSEFSKDDPSDLSIQTPPILHKHKMLNIFSPNQNNPQNGHLFGNEVYPLINPILSNGLSLAPVLLDFSPEWGWAEGGTKVLICFQDANQLLQNSIVDVGFGDTYVHGEVISPCTVRCMTPRLPNLAEKYFQLSIRVTPKGEEVLSIQSFSYPKKIFEYRPSPFNSAPTFRKRHRVLDISYLLDNNESQSLDPPFTHSFNEPPRINSSIFSQPIESQNFPTLGSKKRSSLRMVETLARTSSKVSELRYSLESISLNPDENFNEIDVLDDKALGRLEDDKLEEVLDKLVEKVIGEMVQLASTDNTLEEELKALDQHGYSLLHYACLYGLNKLIPLLIEKGGEYTLNQRTKCGRSHTPLHLAAGGGHIEIVKELLKVGACPLCQDEENFTPIKLALQTSNSAIAQYLRAHQDEWKLCKDCVDSNSYGRGRSNSPSRWKPSSSPRRGTAGGGGSTTQLLKTVFSSLSLHDRCAISMCLSTTKEDPEGELSEKEEGIPGVLSAEDRGRLDAAISMMGNEEKEKLEEQAKVIQQNMRAWVLRRNYKNMRNAAKTLQCAWRERHNAKTSMDFSENSFISPHPTQTKDSNIDDLMKIDMQPDGSPQLQKKISASTTLQAAARGMLTRKKNINKIKNKATTLLALRQNQPIRSWIGKRQTSTDSTP